jgi:hypothetical protein
VDEHRGHDDRLERELVRCRLGHPGVEGDPESCRSNPEQRL